MNVKKIDKKLRKLCPHFFYLLDNYSNNYAIVGGALRSILEHKSIRDIDIICEDTDLLVSYIKDNFTNIQISTNKYHGYKIHLIDYNLYIDMWDPKTHIIPFNSIDDTLIDMLGWNFNSLYYLPKTGILNIDKYNLAKNGYITYNDSESIQRHILLDTVDLVNLTRWLSNNYFTDIKVPSYLLKDRIKQLVNTVSLDEIINEYIRHFGHNPPDDFILEYYHLKYK